MLKRKLSAVILATTVVNLVANPTIAFAETVKYASSVERGEVSGLHGREGDLEESEVSKASISKFNLISNPNFSNYEESFKIDSSNIRISSNKPNFNGTELSNTIDGDNNTYWAPSTRDSENSKTEVEYIFDEVVEINRIIYAARQNQPADNCGFPTKFEIYGSTTDDGEYKLLVEGGGYSSTKDTVEFKFDTKKFKKLKFKFVEVAGKSTWAHIAEIGFFKEDSLLEKMGELFTDESKTTVNSKYNSQISLNELEEEAKQHPFYNDFKEDLMDARIILRNEEIESSDSKVKIFDYANHEGYNNAFRMDKDNIKSITKNAGHYSNKVIENAIDGDLSTYWETNKANSDTWNNEVELEFKDRTVIEKIVYGARPQDAKGFAEEFEIYVSNTSEGDTYKLLTTGSHVRVKDLIEIKFRPTEVKRIKFKFTKSNQNWATINELWFYKEDTVEKEVKSVFTDNLYTVLSPNYDTIQEIEALEERVNNHPLKSQFIEIVEKAKALINGNTIEKSEIFTLSQRGDENSQKNERRQIYAGGNLDVTGYYVMPGESIEVYVDADENGILPMIAFAQVGEVDNNNKGTYRYSLKVGKNVVTAPEGTKGFAVYFVNRALPEEQSYAPKARLEGESLKKYPVYIHGKTDPQEYINELKNHTGENMTDVGGSRYLASGKATEAKIAYITNGYSPLDYVKAMDELVATFDIIAGYDINDENPIHRPTNALYHQKMTNGSGTFASNEYTHLSASSARAIFAGSVLGWGNLHEFAHQIENKDMRLLEVTNNIYSQMTQLLTGKTTGGLESAQRNVDKYFTFEGTKGWGGFGVQYELTLDVFERLVTLLQVTHYFGLDAYSTANRLVRENPTRYATGSYQQTITALSEATGYNLAPHFEYYNYPVEDATKEFTSQFKELDKKIHYTSIPGYNLQQANEEQFTEETKAVISNIKTEEDGFTLTIGTNDNNKGTIAYEIYRDGEFVGFTRGTSHKDTVDISKSYNYEVIAYDYRVNESIKSDAVSSDIGYTPSITVEENVLIKLNEEFNPLNYVQANAYNGEALENVEVIENTLDNTKNGIYKVVYKVEDRNQTTTKEMSVEVVSNYDYASDIDWESATSGWKTVNKDKAVGSNNKIKLNVNGQVKEFDKGIGVATNSEIVYNLEGKGYEYFSTYLGTDKNYGDNRTSIDFIILADGEEVYRSSTINRNSLAEFVNLDVRGVKELKLIADDHDGSGLGDFASWADTKFYTNNTMPTLNVNTETVYVKHKDSFEIMDNVAATDIEDGDITANIVVNAGGFDTNKTGEYDVTYTVADSNGNEVSKVRKIVVYSNADYASDIAWESATSGWKTVNKDKAVGSENKIKLNVNGEIQEFDKGIGVATNSEIVYNLEGKGYGYFTTYLGTDKNFNDKRTTIDFIIEADGVEVYRSNTIKRDSLAEFVELNIAGVKELKLIADDHDGSGLGDFSSWADTKFYTTNGKPVLELDDSITLKVGETVEDVIGNIIATDAEDGDITSKVTVTGHQEVNFNKTGNYKIVYTVTDSDGNTVSKERTISVVDMNDYTNLTDYEWKSAVQSYSTTKKDVSSNGNAIRLTGENGEEITYERGIGAHANATIIYDLSDKNYNYFTSYVGVDRNMYNRPASISFEVYVDGVLKYDSGLMLGKDPQKYVEVEISGAKELKLVVKDGGNGNGSDHGSFGDTRLHYANEERADLTGLKDAISKAESIDVEGYTEESVANLVSAIDAAKELLEADFVSVEQCNKAIKNIEEAIESLKENIDLTEIVEIEDSALKRDIKNQLNLQSDEITIGDMHNLISLECSGSVSSLKGLEYAVNLESLNIDYNEVFDLTPLKDLKKLTNFTGLENFISTSKDKSEDDTYVIEDLVIDINGERLLPTEIILDPRVNPVEVKVDDVLNGNAIILDNSIVNGAKTVEILYESKINNYQGYVMYFLK